MVHRGLPNSSCVSVDSWNSDGGRLPNPFLGLPERSATFPIDVLDPPPIFPVGGPGGRARGPSMPSATGPMALRPCLCCRHAVPSDFGMVHYGLIHWATLRERSDCRRLPKALCPLLSVGPLLHRVFGLAMDPIDGVSRGQPRHRSQRFCDRGGDLSNGHVAMSIPKPWFLCGIH